MANKRIIARIYALLARGKQTNDVSISWTPFRTKADTPLAKGNSAADLLAARECGAPCLSRFSSTGLTSPAPRPRSSKPRPPRRSSASILLRRTRGERGYPRQDQRLPPFDRRQSPFGVLLNAISHAFSSCQRLSPAHVRILLGPSWRLQFFSECIRSVPSIR